MVVNALLHAFQKTEVYRELSLSTSIKCTSLHVNITEKYRSPRPCTSKHAQITVRFSRQ